MKRLKPAEAYFKRDSQSQPRSSTESDQSEGIEVVPGQYGSKFISSKLGNSCKACCKGIQLMLSNANRCLHRIVFGSLMLFVRLTILKSLLQLCTML